MTDSVSDVAHAQSGPQTSAMSNFEYLHPERVVVDMSVSSRKRLFENFAELITSSALSSNPGENEDIPDLEQIFTTLHNRERLGSTGVGKGIALPHGRIDNLRDPVIAVAKLKSPIDYDAPDNEPVWLAVCLLVPTEANEIHLNLLSALATRFNNDEFVREVKETVQHRSFIICFQEFRKSQIAYECTGTRTGRNISTTGAEGFKGY